MDHWIDVAVAAEFPPGTFRTVDAGGIPIAVFNVDADYYAIEDRCSHEAETLSYGSLDGLVITCPRHLAQFSLVSGAVLAPPACEPVATFPVRVRDGVVQVRDYRFD